jgi:membrane protein
LPERQPLWQVLLYGAIGIIALARAGRSAHAASSASVAAIDQRFRRRDTQSRERIRLEPNVKSRRANALWDIPWSGWKEILGRTFVKINDDRLLSVAAGAVFYGLLALFPAIAVFVALYGLFADASTIDAQISALSGVLPDGALGLMHEELKRLTQATGANGIGVVVGFLGALWSATSGLKAIIDALNVAYEEKEERSFVRLNLVAIAYALVGIAAVMVAVGAVVVVPIVLNGLGFGSVSGRLIAIARWPALLILVIVGLAAMYRYLPCRREPRRQWLTVGSALAGTAWLVSSLLFSWYIAHFGTYNATYGSLGAVVGMMMWMWISMVLILIGAQLNAEIERQSAPGPKADKKPQAD